MVNTVTGGVALKLKGNSLQTYENIYFFTERENKHWNFTLRAYIEKKVNMSNVNS